MSHCAKGKSFLHGTDCEGHPLCTARVRLHRQGEQTERSLQRLTVHVLETACPLVVPHVDKAAVYQESERAAETRTS